ncbi:MAG: hypothetical protein ACP6IY_09650 [Promethearchaeia archaeon]
MAKKELTKNELSEKWKLEKINISVDEISYNSGVYGVNWPGKGTKTVTETKAFIKDLIKGIKLAEKINGRKL